MKHYLNRLNWSGAFMIFILCMLAAASRVQDDSIGQSMLIGLAISIPIALIFLFLGIKDK